MKRMIRWGIMATGVIAHKFIRDLMLLDNALPLAIASRSPYKAQEFARQYGIARAYGSYEELAGDPDIDIVYIATPHPFHHECAGMCLNAGKAVLCEKPFAMNAGETAKLINLAREKGVFLMEAMWTRYLPAVIKVREWLNEGHIGTVQFFKADFGFRTELNPLGRFFNPALGGGALLDVGIYPVSFASMVFGSQPQAINSMAHIGTTNVDEQFGAVFGYGDGRMASVSGSVRAKLLNDAHIFGTRGRIYIPDFFMADTAYLYADGTDPVRFGPEIKGLGYCYEASEAMRCLTGNEKESHVMPLNETLAIMKTMDAIRSQWGLSYPGENKNSNHGCT